jgi:Helix-turn-helix of DDE superfamily endonuclease/DDE superfamily endonuclease
MICRYDNLRRYPTVFLKMTGLRLNEFASLLDDMLPRLAEAEQARLRRADRQRAIGAGRHADLAPRDQILLAVIWLRQYPTNEVLGFLFGVSDSTASRVLTRLLPLLEASGKDTMRMPDPGRKHRKELDVLLKETPELAVVIDTFEQRVQRSKDRADADAHFSGKKKQHTLKGQVAVDPDLGTVCDVSDSVVGPTADLTLLKESRLLERLPAGVGHIGDLAYHPEGTRDCGSPSPRLGRHAAPQEARTRSPAGGCVLQSCVCQASDCCGTYD